jgi:two-component system response regulator YesN
MRLIVRRRSSEPGSTRSFAKESEKHAFQLRQKVRIMEVYLECGQQDLFMAEMKQLVGNLKSIDTSSATLSLEMYYALALMFLSFINRWNLTEKTSSQIGLHNLKSVDDLAERGEASGYFLELAKVIFKIREEDQNDRALTAVNTIRRYVKDNLHQDLSLVQLGELVYFNPSYLSRLFKQITGVNLHTYVSDARFERAKELLRGTDRKINEIATKLGFLSATYFTRFFKKYAGMSPQSYRDSGVTRTSCEQA